MPEIRTLKQVKQRGPIRILGEKENIIIHKSDVPPGGLQGQLLAKKSDKNYDTEWISLATSVEENDGRPITSAAVYEEVGNINILLASI